ncbi:MAG TPA: hypothetical protein VI168_03460 [Croceibacterium sp.]
MIRGEEPFRVFQQNLAQLRVFSDRLEIKPPSLFGSEPTVIRFSEIREVRAVSWTPLIQPPAIEIDSELDGEIFTDTFELGIFDSPEMLAISVEGLIKQPAAEARRPSPAPKAPPASSKAAAANRGKPIGAKSAARREAPETSAPDGERAELAQLWDQTKQHGGSIFDAGSGADLTGSPMSGAEFADWVLAGCDDPEAREKLRELLDEAMRFARMMAELKTNPLVIDSDGKLVVSIGKCELDWDWLEPGDDGYPAGAGGPNGEPDPSAGGGGGPSSPAPGKRKPRPKTQEERDRAWLKQHFPKMDHAKVEITAGRENRYNCLGLALGLYRDVWGSGGLSPAQLDEILGKAGFVDFADGDVEFAVWAGSGGITHISRILPDGRHESKFGIGGIQIIHTPGDFKDNNFYSGIEIIGRRKGIVVRDGPQHDF